MLTKDVLIEQGLDESVANEVIEKLGEKTQNFVTKKYLNESVNNAYNNVDRALLTATGVPKNNDEMSSEYATRLLKTTGEKVKSEYEAKMDEMNSSVLSLKQQIKNNKGDESLKQMLEQVERERDELRDKQSNFDKVLTEKETEWQNKYKSTESEFAKYKKISTLKEAIPGNFRKDISSKYRSWLVDNAINEVIEKYDKIEKDESGNVILKNTEKFDVIKASDYFGDKFKDDLENRQIQGGGARTGQRQYPSELTLPEDMPRNEKYQAIKEHVIAQGIPVTSNDFANKMKELQIEHGIIKNKEK